VRSLMKSGRCAPCRHGPETNIPERDAIWMMIRSRVVALAFLAGLAGCDHGARTYDSLSQIASEGDLSVVRAAAVPEDATLIDIRSDVESGEYYISYNAKDPLAWIRDGGLKKAEVNIVPMIRSSVGFGASLPPDAEFYYRCGISRRLGAEGMSAYELVLVGLDGKRRYFWNSFHDEDLERALCLETSSR